MYMEIIVLLGIGIGKMVGIERMMETEIKFMME